MSESVGAPEAQPGEAPSSGARVDALLRRLEWTVLRRLDGLLQGDWASPRRGHGIDLADLREYQLHDEVRHIDWNVTARLQVPHVRRFTEDRQLTAWFLLDLSGSMLFGSAGRRKLDGAIDFVGALARLLTRHGDRVGAVMYRGPGAEAVLPAGGGRRHVLDLLARMRRLAEPVAKGGSTSASGPHPQRASDGRATATAPAPASETDRARAGWLARWRRQPSPAQAQRPVQATREGTALADLLSRGLPVLNRRSLVIVVSDFVSEPGWQAPLARLAQRHDLVAVRLLDPLEMALPDLGLVTVEDAETGAQLFIDSADPAFRARYEALARQREQALRDDLAASGADTLELTTEDDLAETLLRFADLRRQRARLPGSRRFPAALRPQAAPSTQEDARP